MVRYTTKCKRSCYDPIDHPHGGGEGKSSGGRPSVNYWGKLSKEKKLVLKNLINFLVVIKI